MFNFFLMLFAIWFAGVTVWGAVAIWLYLTGEITVTVSHILISIAMVITWPLTITATLFSDNLQ